MLFVFLSWIYIFFVASLVGVAVNKLSKLKNTFVITQLLGFFSISVFAGYFAIFLKIGILFHGVLLFVLLLLLIRYGAAFRLHLHQFYLEIRELSLFFKCMLLAVSLLILAQCASPPYIIDNESYYIQTIKWLNEHGFVNGLANLHFFFGQTSGWHILQSVFNLDFLYDNFNDLSGYCLWLASIFSLKKLHFSFTSPKNKQLNLAIGILPLGSILLFQFISAPSPDLPMMVLCFVVFYFLLKDYPTYSRSSFVSVSLLCFFVIFIKTIGVFLIFVPLYMFAKNYRQLKNLVFPLVLVGFITLLLMLIKNQILTGYPLYPLKLVHFHTDYAIPQELVDFFYRGTKRYAYLLSYAEYSEMTWWQRFLHWLQLPGLKGFFNKIILILLAVFPFLLKKFPFEKPLAFIYFLTVAQMLILFITSPQYRFFLMFILFFSGLIFVHFVRSEKIIKFSLILGTLLVAVPLFFPLNFKIFTENPLMETASTFRLDYLIEPHKNSQFDYTFETVEEGNLDYRTPPDEAFFWLMGDCELPCVNQKQIEYFKKHYNFVPQLRDTDLKNGFYSKDINPKPSF